MKRLRTAVLGLGRIGWGRHIPCIMSHPDKFELVAVVDTLPERLAEAKEKFGVDGYTDLAEMVGAVHPDLVIVASPNHLHKLHACTAMEMGCDVFLEKPMAESYESACAIVACAKRTGRKIMVYQPRRALAATNQLISIIQSGRIGRVSSIQVCRCGYIRRADWQAFRKFGGGMINNYGPHYIDVLLYLLGEKIDRLLCTAKVTASAGDAEDTVKILMQTESGIPISIDINQASALHHSEWLICGEYGAIMTEPGTPETEAFQIRYYDPAQLPPITVSDSLAAANRKYSNDVPIPWVEERFAVDSGFAVDFYDKLYEYMALDVPPYIPIEESLYVMELIQECRRSAGLL